MPKNRGVFHDTLKDTLAWGLGTFGVVMLFQIVDPWTNSLALKLPFLGLAALSIFLLVLVQMYLFD